MRPASSSVSRMAASRDRSPSSREPLGTTHRLPPGVVTRAISTRSSRMRKGMTAAWRYSRISSRLSVVGAYLAPLPINGAGNVPVQPTTSQVLESYPAMRFGHFWSQQTGVFCYYLLSFPDRWKSSRQRNRSSKECATTADRLSDLRAGVRHRPVLPSTSGIRTHPRKRVPSWQPGAGEFHRESDGRHGMARRRE